MVGKIDDTTYTGADLQNGTKAVKKGECGKSIEL